MIAEFCNPPLGPKWSLCRSSVNIGKHYKALHIPWSQRNQAAMATLTYWLFTWSAYTWASWPWISEAEAAVEAIVTWNDDTINQTIIYPSCRKGGLVATSASVQRCSRRRRASRCCAPKGCACTALTYNNNLRREGLWLDGPELKTRSKGRRALNHIRVALNRPSGITIGGVLLPNNTSNTNLSHLFDIIIRSEVATSDLVDGATSYEQLPTLIS